MLIAASASLDQTNVSGEARALTCDNRDPGQGRSAGNPDGTSDTRASRNWLVSGRKHNGALSRTRPRMRSGAEAAKIAARVPPSEWPMRRGLQSEPSEI